ncbi:schlafen-like protein 1 [Siniperca chuatsi]|uniref:schlafen-like protein 1 n=1 Tax=Siniperca chuatsi TaxID=119488 RepID=UPI001CE21B39|nr:schlafen-like protein 1 [Siniperca chuatsi]XP_044026909.1 schlafen-like protein 1 [Siniperca chuatsi]
MHHRPWKRKMKGRGKIPGTSSKKSRGRLRRPSYSPIPSTSAHVGTSQSQSYRSNVSTPAGSPIASPAKKQKGTGYNHSWRWRGLYKKKGKTRGTLGTSKWAKQKRRSGRSTRNPQPQRPKVQNQRANQGTPAKSIRGQDITSCRWLHYGAHIGNETRSIEFKQGGGCYMQNTFCEHVCIYGCAFLNSGGGSLLVGVCDNGMVCGVHFSHKMEDKTRLQVDEIAKHFNPPLLPYNYSLHFLPVVKPREHHLKVLCLTFRAPPAFTEPTLFQIDHGKVYMRRDGSVQGPLGASVILEWSRQMWTSKVQQLEQRVLEARTEKWFLAGQVHGLLQSIDPLHRIIASLQPQKKTAPSRGQKRKMKQNLKTSSRQNSRASASLPPLGTPDARPAHNTGDPDVWLRCTQ